MVKMKLTAKITILWVVAKIIAGNLNVVYLGHVLAWKKFVMALHNAQMLAMKCFVQIIIKVILFIIPIIKIIFKKNMNKFSPWNTKLWYWFISV